MITNIRNISFAFIIAVLAGVMISIPVQLRAEIFKAEVSVEADDNGVVIISGGEGIVALAQCCPDEWKEGCPNNLNIKRQSNKFTLNRKGLSEHQNAFNFRDSSGKWLSIPDRQRVIVGKNIDQVKTYFIYTGPIPK
jgi:hypothetical protein